MEFFGSYRLSRPPLVKDDYDPDNQPPPSSLRSRAADAVVVLSAVVGAIVALSGVGDERPAQKLAIGVGTVLLGFAGAQLLLFAPEVTAAWKRGVRGWIGVLTCAASVGAFLIYWGATT